MRVVKVAVLVAVAWVAWVGLARLQWATDRA